MEFILTESQLLRLIKENRSEDNLSNSLKRMSSYTNNLINRISKTYGINLRMFLTWGVSIAGLVMPLDDFIKTKNFELDENEIYLILAGVAFVIFFEGKRGMTKILGLIKEKGLGDIFDEVLSKGLQLKESFTKFLKSIKVISGQLIEIISYAFLIPIVVDIQNYISETTTINEATILVSERLLASGVVLLSKEFLQQIISKIIKRLQ